MVTVLCRDMSSNDITSLPPHFFDSQANMQQLYLSSNKLTVLPDRLFAQTPLLLYLFVQLTVALAMHVMRDRDLGENLLSQLPATVFPSNSQYLTFLFDNSQHVECELMRVL